MRTLLFPRSAAHECAVLHVTVPNDVFPPNQGRRLSILIETGSGGSCGANSTAAAKDFGDARARRKNACWQRFWSQREPNQVSVFLVYLVSKLYVHLNEPCTWPP